MCVFQTYFQWWCVVNITEEDSQLGMEIILPYDVDHMEIKSPYNWHMAANLGETLICQYFSLSKIKALLELYLSDLLPIDHLTQTSLYSVHLAEWHCNVCRS